MICLGIETTAHTFGVGIATYKNKQWKILANTKSTYTTKKGGIIPSKAADHHVTLCKQIANKALKEAKLTIKDIDLIAFSQSPGMGHMLRVGTFFARTLSLQHNIPLIGVNHCIAHLEVGRALTKAKDPILLYASGANTQIIAYEAGRYRIMGETLDTGIGNFLDSFARELGLGFPGGPKIEQLAKKSKMYKELPYSVKGMDVAFSGLLTHLKQKIKTKTFKKEALCFSVQETAFAMLVEVAERALAHTGKNELLLGGGVACNKRLQEMCTIMCKERKAKMYCPEKQYLIDNGAMIAITGTLAYKAGQKTTILKSQIQPYIRTDEIEVTWRK